MRTARMLVVLGVAIAAGLSPRPALAAAAPPAGATVAVPACTADPVGNTRAVQGVLDGARPGDTVVLPAGDCVLAKCDVVQGRLCYGALGVPHRAALNIGGRSGLTIKGAPGGSSTLRLDPAPATAPGSYPYCGATNVLSIQLSQGITLHGFTIDGSDDRLPAVDAPCPTGHLDEHLHDIGVTNTADLTIDHLQVRNAHGDGLNLIAEQSRTAIPFTERVTVTATDFLGNDRAGVTFQRNVGHVTLSGNHFLDSGDDQDLDMEPTGGPTDRGPFDVSVDRNVFERLHGHAAVALGATASVQPATGIRFTGNTIVPAAKAATAEGGCIVVYSANDTTVAGNTVIGAHDCQTIWAQRVDGLRIEGNRLESYDNEQRNGVFQPRAVVDVSERVVNQGDPAVCGAPPKDPCPYAIRYPDHLAVTGNTVVQHVAGAPGIRLSNGDDVVITDNDLAAAGDVTPAGAPPANARIAGIALPFGVANLPSYGVYVNEKTAFKTYTVTGNRVSGFPIGVHDGPPKAGVELAVASFSANRFDAALPGPRGIQLEGPPTAPAAAFVKGLTVDANVFGCGFFDPKAPGVPPANAFLRPSAQVHRGSIGTTVPCS